MCDSKRDHLQASYPGAPMPQQTPVLGTSVPCTIPSPPAHALCRAPREGAAGALHTRGSASEPPAGMVALPPGQAPARTSSAPSPALDARRFDSGGPEAEAAGWGAAVEEGAEASGAGEACDGAAGPGPWAVRRPCCAHVLCGMTPKVPACILARKLRRVRWATSIGAGQCSRGTIDFLEHTIARCHSCARMRQALAEAGVEHWAVPHDMLMRRWGCGQLGEPGGAALTEFQPTLALEHPAGMRPPVSCTMSSA